MFVESAAVQHLLPELVLILAATAIFVGGAFVRRRSTWSLVALTSFVVAGMLLARGGPPVASFLGPVAVDGLAVSLRWLCILAGVFFSSLTWHGGSRELTSEQLGLTMLAVAGTMLAVGANDLILLFMGLELISIPTYVLLFVGRKNRDSAEAATKYFFLSIASSGILLYGLSFLYGLGGATNILGDKEFPGIREALQHPTTELAPLGSIALLLILTGLGFKLAAAPFHFYAPDVYQGATNTNAALLAVLPKIAASAGIVRLVTAALPSQADFAWQILLLLAALSMTLGNVCALWQKNLRRMMAYSSIAHGGYMLVGMTVAQAGIAVSGDTYEGITGLVFYIAVYTFASIGTFAALSTLGDNGDEPTVLDDLAGCARTQPVAAAALAVFMFSLAGVPPLAGFWGKFTLFSSAVRIAAELEGPASSWFYGLAILGVLNAAIGATYYLRIVGVMYFQNAARSEAAPQQPHGALAATLACALLTVGAGIMPGTIMRGARSADQGVKTIAKTVATTTPSNAAIPVVSR